ncbi:MAG TPA: DUF2911 domain-containing protein [Gemmatimonadales bacterium]|nr:DUF2911 domain-containing protein [Gemmatimonadales bacterium]
MLILTALLALATPTAVAPAPCVTMMTERMPLAKRQSPLDSLMFTVGKTEVKLCYSRPSLRGRKMIGGEAVPYGKLWRTGSNEPTMIHTTGPITVAGVELAPGSYSLYTIPGEKEYEVILNRSVSQWGHESSYTDDVKKQEVGHGKASASRTKAPVEKLTFSAAPSPEKAKTLVLEWDSAHVEIPVSAK